MYISRTKFLFITFLFFLLPFSVNYQLLLFGEKTSGVVIDYKGYWGRSPNMPKIQITHSIIRYYYNPNEYVDFLGPEDVKYPLGKKVKIYYYKNAPEEHIMLNIPGLILNNKMIFPGVVLILWLTFYLTMRQMYKKPHQKMKVQNRFKSLE